MTQGPAANAARIHACAQLDIASAVWPNGKLLANQCRIFAAREREHVALNLAPPAAIVKTLVSSPAAKS
jgi:hypothetical protein